jgi:hypothetical protein
MLVNNQAKFSPDMENPTCMHAWQEQISVLNLGNVSYLIFHTHTKLQVAFINTQLANSVSETEFDC